MTRYRDFGKSIDDSHLDYSKIEYLSDLLRQLAPGAADLTDKSTGPTYRADRVIPDCYVLALDYIVANNAIYRNRQQSSGQCVRTALPELLRALNDGTPANWSNVMIADYCTIGPPITVGDCCAMPTDKTICGRLNSIWADGNCERCRGYARYRVYRPVFRDRWLLSGGPELYSRSHPDEPILRAYIDSVYEFAGLYQQDVFKRTL